MKIVIEKEFWMGHIDKPTCLKWDDGSWLKCQYDPEGREIFRYDNTGNNVKTMYLINGDKKITEGDGDRWVSITKDGQDRVCVYQDYTGFMTQTKYDRWGLPCLKQSSSGLYECTQRDDNGRVIFLERNNLRREVERDEFGQVLKTHDFFLNDDGSIDEKNNDHEAVTAYLDSNFPDTAPAGRLAVLEAAKVPISRTVYDDLER